MKNIIFSILIVVSLTGCMSMGGGAAKAIAAASKDPACITLHLQTPYGTLDYSRTMPTLSTNAFTVPVTGNIMVNPK